MMRKNSGKGRGVSVKKSKLNEKNSFCLQDLSPSITSDEYGQGGALGGTIEVQPEVETLLDAQEVTFFLGDEFTFDSASRLQKGIPNVRLPVNLEVRNSQGRIEVKTPLLMRSGYINGIKAGPDLLDPALASDPYRKSISNIWIAIQEKHRSRNSGETEYFRSATLELTFSEESTVLEGYRVINDQTMGLAFVNMAFVCSQSYLSLSDSLHNKIRGRMLKEMQTLFSELCKQKGLSADLEQYGAHLVVSGPIHESRMFDVVYSPNSEDIEGPERSPYKLNLYLEPLNKDFSEEDVRVPDDYIEVLDELALKYVGKLRELRKETLLGSDPKCNILAFASAFRNWARSNRLDVSDLIYRTFMDIQFLAGFESPGEVYSRLESIENRIRTGEHAQEVRDRIARAESKVSPKRRFLEMNRDIKGNTLSEGYERRYILIRDPKSKAIVDVQEYPKHSQSLVDIAKYLVLTKGTPSLFLAYTPSYYYDFVTEDGLVVTNVGVGVGTKINLGDADVVFEVEPLLKSDLKSDWADILPFLKSKKLLKSAIAAIPKNVRDAQGITINSVEREVGMDDKYKVLRRVGVSSDESRDMFEDGIDSESYVSTEAVSEPINDVPSPDADRVEDLDDRIKEMKSMQAREPVESLFTSKLKLHKDYQFVLILDQDDRIVSVLKNNLSTMSNESKDLAGLTKYVLYSDTIDPSSAGFSPFPLTEDFIVLKKNRLGMKVYPKVGDYLFKYKLLTRKDLAKYGVQFLEFSEPALRKEVYKAIPKKVRDTIDRDSLSSIKLQPLRLDLALTDFRDHGTPLPFELKPVRVEDLTLPLDAEEVATITDAAVTTTQPKYFNIPEGQYDYINGKTGASVSGLLNSAFRLVLKKDPESDRPVLLIDYPETEQQKVDSLLLENQNLQVVTKPLVRANWKDLWKLPLGKLEALKDTISTIDVGFLRSVYTLLPKASQNELLTQSDYVSYLLSVDLDPSQDYISKFEKENSRIYEGSGKSKLVELEGRPIHSYGLHNEDVLGVPEGHLTKLIRDFLLRWPEHTSNAISIWRSLESKVEGASELSLGEVPIEFEGLYYSPVETKHKVKTTKGKKYLERSQAIVALFSATASKIGCVAGPDIFNKESRSYLNLAERILNECEKLSPEMLQMFTSLKSESTPKVNIGSDDIYDSVVFAFRSSENYLYIADIIHEGLYLSAKKMLNFLIVKHASLLKEVNSDISTVALPEYSDLDIVPIVNLPNTISAARLFIGDTNPLNIERRDQNDALLVRPRRSWLEGRGFKDFEKTKPLSQTASIRKVFELDLSLGLNVTNLQVSESYRKMIRDIAIEYTEWLLNARIEAFSDEKYMSWFSDAFKKWQNYCGIEVVGNLEEILNPYTLSNISPGEVGHSVSESPVTQSLEGPQEDAGFRSYSVKNESDRVTVLDAWFASDEYRKFELWHSSTLTDPELKTAQSELQECLRAEGIASRKYTRVAEGIFRCVFNEGQGLGKSYLSILESEIDNPLLTKIAVDEEPLNTESLSKVNSAVDRYRKSIGQDLAQINLDRQLDAMIKPLEKWLLANNISLEDGDARSLIREGKEESADLGEKYAAEAVVQQKTLTDLLESAEKKGDSKEIIDIESQKSALAHAQADYRESSEVGEPSDLPSTIEVIEDAIISEDIPREGKKDWGSREDWTALSSVETDSRTQTEIERVLVEIEIDRITDDLIESLYEDLNDRGLGRFESVVKVNDLNGEVYVGAVEGYLEGIPLPYDLTFDERREFVKAIKSFEDRKYQANMDLLVKVATLMGLPLENKADLLAYEEIPQFTVRKDYLNEYVERSQPSEVDVIEQEVRYLLEDFETDPTQKDIFFVLKPMIESLFRYDPSNPIFHSYLDRLVEAADSVNLFGKDRSRYQMPNIARLQSKAASVYGEQGYVPVVEDPIAGLDQYVAQIAESALNIADSESVAFYEMFDPEMLFEFFQDQGMTIKDAYLSLKDMEQLPSCVQRSLDVRESEAATPSDPDASEAPPSDPDAPEYGYSFEMEFGNFDAPQFRRCRDLERMVTYALNESLTVFAKSVFYSIKTLYSLYALASDVELDIVYGDFTSVRFEEGRTNKIRVHVRETFDQSDINQVYREMCDLLAEIIVHQEVDLDPEDKDLDGEDLLGLMRIPTYGLRSNPGAERDFYLVRDDLLAISENKRDYEIDVDVLRTIYESCMGMEIGKWTLDQYIGETYREASLRRQRLAAEIGLSRYLPYDISIALEDIDFEYLTNRVMYFIREALSRYDTRVQRDEYLRREIAKLYRSIVFPKYFPEEGVRVVHVTSNEADQFVKTHHSLLGASGINRRGLLLTIGAEVDGKLVAVATANTPTGNSKDSKRETDLSRVASDGSVKGVSSLLAGIVLQLTLENKLNREVSKSPLFITYSTVDEVGSTYMALLGMGLRPVGLYIPPKRVTGAKSGGSTDIYSIPKIKWEAGEDAKPANLDIARFLKPSYADQIIMDSTIESEGQPWGDDYICLCILAVLKYPRGCSADVKKLADKFKSTKESVASRKVRKSLIQYARTMVDSSDPIRKRNVLRFLKPIDICAQITNRSPMADDTKRIVRRNIQRIRQEVSTLSPSEKCSKSDITKALTTYEKSL